MIRDEYDIFRKSVEKELSIALVPEYKFHNSRKWRFDFAIPDLHIAIEVEGGIFIYGRHNHAASMLKDFEKYNAAAIDGWKILKFTPRQLNESKTIETIREAVRNALKNINICQLLKT